MTYEMVRKSARYEAVRFNDEGRERWLIVRSGDTAPVVVAEALGHSTGVLIAESLNDGVKSESVTEHNSNECDTCLRSARRAMA